jgi:hypothetical protein
MAVGRGKQTRGIELRGKLQHGGRPNLRPINIGRAAGCGVSPSQSLIRSGISHPDDSCNPVVGPNRPPEKVSSVRHLQDASKPKALSPYQNLSSSGEVNRLGPRTD